MCLCWHSYLCWRFILVCVKMIVAPWILKCTSTWLKTFEHASCSLPIAISLCIDCWGLFHACSFIFEHFYQEFGCCVFFFSLPVGISVSILGSMSALARFYYLRSNRNTTYHCVSCQNRKIMFSTVYSKNSFFLCCLRCAFFSITCINKRELITILWCSDDEALRFRFGVVECVFRLPHSFALISHFYRHKINIVFVLFFCAPRKNLCQWDCILIC